MRQVMDETLRMSTLAPYAARYSDRDMVVDGYTVPANTPIIHALGVSLKNETQWEDVYKCVTHTFTDIYANYNNTLFLLNRFDPDYTRHCKNYSVEITSGVVILLLVHWPTFYISLVMMVEGSLVPRPLADFISQPCR